MNEMEYTTLNNIDKPASRIALGTWAIGGTDWGGSDEEEAIATITKALDMGITVIDTAPAYGFGKSEKIVGKAIQQSDKDRDDIIIATKVGLEWDNEGNLWRNSSKERIEQEMEDSLERLQTDYVDIYQVHWPDDQTPAEETATKMKQLLDDGKIRAIGVSNYSPQQMDEFRKYAPLHLDQPPYNMFERGIEDDVMPYCKENDINMMTYGALCRGLLTGKIDEDSTFEGDDLRNIDPKFSEEHLSDYLKAYQKLEVYSTDMGLEPIHLAVVWILKKGVDIAIWGARKPEQLDDIPAIKQIELLDPDMIALDRIVENNIENPLPRPDFMAPPNSRD